MIAIFLVTSAVTLVLCVIGLCGAIFNKWWVKWITLLIFVLALFIVSLFKIIY